MNKKYQTISKKRPSTSMQKKKASEARPTSVTSI